MLVNAQPQSLANTVHIAVIIGAYTAKKHQVGAKQTPIRVLTHEVFPVYGGLVYLRVIKLKVLMVGYFN